MLMLAATTETLEVITLTTAPLDSTVTYADLNQTVPSFNPAVQRSNISTIATTTVTNAPAASVQRQIKLIMLVNKDLANSQTFTLQTSVSGTKTVLFNQVVLAAGEVWEYSDGAGVVCFSPFAQRKMVSNVTLINPPTITSQWLVNEPDVRDILQKLLAEQRTTNVLLVRAANGDSSQDIGELDNMQTDNYLNLNN